MPDNNLKTKLDILYTSLQKKNRWYTGISIKTFLKKRIFNLYKDFNNPAINSGRWSAYCHYSQVSAFNNLLDKHHIKNSSIVLVHPFLPTYLVDELIKRKTSLVSVDIEKNTLSFDSDLFEKFLSGDDTKIDLVIHYQMSGLIEPTKNQINIAQHFSIPSMVVLDNSKLTFETLHLFENLRLGSVLFNFGDSFWDEHLNQALESKLKTNNWYISWFLETRITSSLEYHLKESQDYFLPVIESYFYLLMQQYQKQKFIKGWIYKTWVSNLLLSKKIPNSVEAVESIQKNYPKLFNFAVCDIVFDLENQLPVTTPIENLGEIIDYSSQIQQKSKDLYNYFLQELYKRPEGSLEIPDFYIDKVYQKYFIFTTEENYWKSTLSSHYKIFNLAQLHPIFLNNENLENTQFASKFLLLIDLE